MNELTKFLVEGILNEETEKAVALFGGGFKPPTKGHLDVVNQGIKQNPEVSEVKILVGGGTRNGFTQDQAVKIWNLYNDVGFIKKPATIIPVSSPFTYYKNYLKDNPDDKVYIFIGSREGDEDDKFDVKQRSEFVKKYSDNVIPVEVSTTGGVSGTMARELFKTDLDGFRNMFPENLLDQDFNKILDILNNKSTNTTQKPASNKTEPLSPLNEDPKKGTLKKQKLKENKLSLDDTILLSKTLRDKDKMKQIHSLLVQMFPKQKEFLDYNYKNDQFNDFRPFIFYIDEYIFEGPKLIPHTELKLDPDAYAEREKKYKEYIEGKTDKYFNSSNSDPRKVDLSKVPPITIDAEGMVAGGNHRAFLAIKQQKPLKAYQVVKANNTHPNVEKILNIVGRKKQKLKENQMSMDDFNLVGAVLRDKNKAEKIHKLLLQMFPQQKELLDYNYKNDSYAEFKRVIFHIDKYNIEGPKLIQHTKLKLDPEVYKERDKKYKEYAEGKIKKYFRDSDSDPRKLDLSKLPPITIDSGGEVMDGNHRAFLAIKQQKPLKAYQIVDTKNDHANVEKILNIVGRKKQEENIDPKSQKKHKGKSAPFGSAYEPLNENATYSSKIDYKQQIKDLTKHMIKKGMNILPLPKVIFKHGDQENASQFLGKTAYYSPSDMTVVLYTEGRHPKDIVRSFAHEMVHHIQNLEDRLGSINTTNTQEDDNLNDIEREAYTKGNMTFRNWTDSLDGEEVTSLNEDLTLSPFDYDQDGNESRIGRDINNKKGWRRLGSKSSQNKAIKNYLNKYTSNYKWTNLPKSSKFSKENDKMYKTPYIMYVHLLQTSEGKNNIIDALNGMVANEPDNTMKQVLQALILVFTGKEKLFKKVYTQYKDMIEKNAKNDSGANPFAALKYANENFNNKEEIFNKFVRNGWSAGRYNLNEKIVGEKIECDNCGWSWNIVDGGDDLYICHKCDHDNEPENGDPFGLKVYARELVKEVFKKSVTIDMDVVNAALEDGIFIDSQETDENTIAIIDAAPQGKVPHPVFLDFYAKFNKYFGEESDKRILDELGLEQILTNILNLPNEDIQIVMNHYNTTDQDSVEWFEQHDNELERDEEHNIPGFNDADDDYESVVNYRKQQLAKSLEEQKEVRIFTTNCGCDKT